MTTFNTSEIPMVWEAVSQELWIKTKYTLEIYFGYLKCPNALHTFFKSQYHTYIECHDL